MKGVTTSFRLTERIGLELKTLMAKEKKTASEIMRKAVLFYAARGTVLSADMDVIFQELFELKLNFARIGGNLNQIARYFNTAAELKPEIEENLSELKEEVKELSSFLNTLTESFGKLLYAGNKPRRKTTGKP
jgi:uncharacterized phage infection (PIP) family protein YhgE